MSATASIFEPAAQRRTHETVSSERRASSAPTVGIAPALVRAESRLGNPVLEHELAQPTNALIASRGGLLAGRVSARRRGRLAAALARFFRRNKNMSEIDAGYIPVKQARMLLEMERAEMRAQLHRERIVCLGAIVIMGTALLLCCWGLS